MRLLDDLIMLYRWAKEGWEVHPIDMNSDFGGWV
jgi:hypothetical protein